MAGGRQAVDADGHPTGLGDLVKIEDGSVPDSPGHRTIAPPCFSAEEEMSAEQIGC